MRLSQRSGRTNHGSPYTRKAAPAVVTGRIDNVRSANNDDGEVFKDDRGPRVRS